MSSFDEVEQRIANIERELPLEIRVVVSHRPLRSAAGGLRLLIVLVVLVTLGLELFWVPLIPWLAPVLCLVLLFLPTQVLAAVPGGRLLLSARARGLLLEEEAWIQFRHLKMDVTPLGNALLIFFCTKERRFVILPDAQLQLRWPAEHWESYSRRIAERMRASPAGLESRIAAAVLDVLEDIRLAAREQLGTRSADVTPPKQDGVLPNAVVTID